MIKYSKIERLLFGLIITITLISCSNQPEQKYNKNGVSFTIPDGWIFEEDEDASEGVRQVWIEKTGLSDSGAMGIVWAPEQMQPEQMLELFRETYDEGDMFDDLQLGTVTTCKFGAYTGVGCVNTFKVMNMTHHSYMYCFKQGDKTIYIVKQEALEDREKNKSGFQTIENSFKVE